MKIYNSIVKYRLKSFERSNRNSFEWSKAGLDHIAASQARLAVKEQTDLIRVYIYSKTHGSENISELYHCGWETVLVVNRSSWKR